MAEETLVDACERYLSHKGCTLWGRAFDIIRPKTRREAAEWLAQQVEAVQAQQAVASVPIGVAVESVKAGEHVRVLLQTSPGDRGRVRQYDAEEDIAANELVALCDPNSAGEHRVQAFRRNGRVP